MTFRDTAIAYAKQGWRVVPLHHVVPEGRCSCGESRCARGGKLEKSVGKHPRLPSWQIDASTDPVQIHTWWSRWPNANIGIATGKLSGILVLDVDCHQSAPGFASLALLENRLGALPQTRAAQTGSGGRHLLFRYPRELSVGNSAGWLSSPGIDWRGDGGQIVVAPSVALAGTYVWLNDIDIAELPRAWVEAHIEYEAERAKKSRKNKTVTSSTGITPPPTPLDIEADDVVLSCARSASNMDKFNTLWAGKWSEAGYESQSNADLALCSMLAFWCNSDDESPDPDRLDRLFRRSGLYRDKWERTDYRNRTIDLAVEQEKLRRSSDRALARAVEESALPNETPFLSTNDIAPEKSKKPNSNHQDKRLFKKLNKLAEESAKHDNLHRRISAMSLARVLLGGAFSSSENDIKALESAFSLIGFEEPELSIDEIMQCLRATSKELDASHFVIATRALHTGRDRKKKWLDQAPVREAKKEAEYLARRAEFRRQLATALKGS